MPPYLPWPAHSNMAPDDSIASDGSSCPAAVDRESQPAEAIGPPSRRAFQARQHGSGNQSEHYSLQTYSSWNKKYLLRQVQSSAGMQARHPGATGGTDMSGLLPNSCDLIGGELCIRSDDGNLWRIRTWRGMSLVARVPLGLSGSNSCWHVVAVASNACERATRPATSSSH